MKINKNQKHNLKLFKKYKLEIVRNEWLWYGIRGEIKKRFRCVDCGHEIDSQEYRFRNYEEDKRPLMCQCFYCQWGKTRPQV